VVNVEAVLEERRVKRLGQPRTAASRGKSRSNSDTCPFAFYSPGCPYRWPVAAQVGLGCRKKVLAVSRHCW
jgi:hypothetical protein